MHKSIILSFLLICNLSIAQSLYFPPLTGSAWETSNPDNLGWKTNMLPELKSFLENSNSKAFIILKDGKIVVEYYMNGHDATSNWYWASAGKSLTSTLIGIAASQGKIDLEKPSSLYLGKNWTSLSSEQEEKIKVIHHLSMTTGLDDDVSFDCTDPPCLKYKTDPGKRWAYHNAPYTLCDGIIEGATSQNLNKFFRDELGSKIGMSGLFVKAGYNNIFYSKARDMARFGLFILAKGNWASSDVLTDKTYYEKMVTSSQDINPSYGYLWWLNGKGSFQLPKSQLKINLNLIPNAPEDMICALGKNDQKIYVIPSQNIVVIRMGDAGTSDDNPVPIKYDFALWEKLGPIINITSEISTTNISKERISYVRNKTLIVDDKINVKDIKITSIQGKIVHQFSDHNAENVSHLNPGIYIVYITDRNKKIYINKVFIR